MGVFQVVAASVLALASRMEPRLGIELGLSAAELLQFLKEDGSSQDVGMV